MENIKNQEVDAIVEQFESTPREELVGKIKNMLSPEEIKGLTDKDINLIINVARRYLSSERAHTAEDALKVGTIARTEAVRQLGDTSIGNVFVRNKNGEIVAVGEDEVKAMQKAQEMTR